MTPTLNPVQVAIRDHVAAAYPAWRSFAPDPVPTRAGTRYLGTLMARLLAPALEAVGLLVWESHTERVFVTRAGRQVTRATLRDLIAGALAEHDDAVLADSIGSASFWECLADAMPLYEAEEIERAPREAAASASATPADYVRARRAVARANERASARAFLAAVVAGGRRSGDSVDGPALYADAERAIRRKVEAAERGDLNWTIDGTDGELWAVPGRKVFYAVADEVLGTRRRSARGYFYVIARAVRRVLAWRRRPLSPETEEGLRSLAALARGAATEEPAPRRLRWRDRPLDEGTASALRGLAATVIEADQ